MKYLQQPQPFRATGLGNMEPTIQLLTEKKLTGMRMSMSFSGDKTRALWNSFMPLRKQIKNKIGNSLYSLQIYPPGFFDHFNPDAIFQKWACVEVKDLNIIPNQMECLLMPGGLYAVFFYRGDSSMAPQTFQYIFETWLPSSAYLVDNRPHFELLAEKYKQNDAASEEEIWIPIQLKESSGR